MSIKIAEMCKWAGTNPSQKNFLDGEQLVSKKYLLKCGKMAFEGSCSEVNIRAFCLQTSKLRGNPHEIVGKITRQGEILSMTCTCPSRAGEKCKHITATLLYLSR